MPRRKPSDMKKMTPDEQEAVALRFERRKNVREANDALFERAMQWVTGQALSRREFMRQFNAGGHRGEYLVNPSVTTKQRLKKMQEALPELQKRVDDTPLDFMGVLELNYVYDRIALAVELLHMASSGTMDEAIQIYEIAGNIIRAKVYRETEHWPEEFALPIESGRITGEENPALFQVQPHQPTLLQAPQED